MDNDIFNLIFMAVVFIAVIYVFVRISMRVRKHSGSMLTTMHASTYEFLSKDAREAVEEVVEMKANKKMEEESSDKPKDDL
ncbi:hypothetical protein MNBD_IGNAVI01-753 [hydrothermal vent metagenome]|uniref:Uncharacterized protein n=1 Tax=hydrothermal vent metagenome TaxID=652676 RepID=A0A3B1C4C1_9ZZZZ